MRIRFAILGFSGVDKPEQFVNIDALRRLTHQTLKSVGGFAEFAGIVLRNRCLKCSVKLLIRFAALHEYGTRPRCSCSERDESY